MLYLVNLYLNLMYDFEDCFVDLSKGLGENFWVIELVILNYFVVEGFWIFDVKVYEKFFCFCEEWFVIIVGIFFFFFVVFSINFKVIIRLFIFFFFWYWFSDWIKNVCLLLLIILIRVECSLWMFFEIFFGFWWCFCFIDRVFIFLKSL